MSEGKTYQLRSFRDVVDLLTVDQIKVCMSEMAELMVQAKLAQESILQVAKGSGAKDKVWFVWPETLEWRDDGRGEIVVRFSRASGDDRCVENCE